MVDPGICNGCRHVRVIENDRGSKFYWCGRSKTDARFPKYPRLPVLRCVGFEVAEEAVDAPVVDDGVE